MSKTTKIIANRSMRYGTRMLQAGDTFDAKARDARLLVAIGRAKLVTEQELAKPVTPPTPDEASKIASALGIPPVSESVPLIEALRTEYFDRTGKTSPKNWGTPKLIKEVASLREPGGA